MFVVLVLFLLSLDVDFHIPVLAFVFLLSEHRNIKLIKSQNNSLQILTILHSIDEVSAHYEGLVRERVVWTKNLAT